MWTILASYPGHPFVFCVELENLGRGGMLCAGCNDFCVDTIWDMVCTDTHTLINPRMWGIVSPATTFQDGETMQGMCSSLKHTRMKICQGIKSSCSMPWIPYVISHTQFDSSMTANIVPESVRIRIRGSKVKKFSSPTHHPSLECLVHGPLQCHVHLLRLWLYRA